MGNFKDYGFTPDGNLLRCPGHPGEETHLVMVNVTHGGRPGTIAQHARIAIRHAQTFRDEDSDRQQAAERAREVSEKILDRADEAASKINTRTAVNVDYCIPVTDDEWKALVDTVYDGAQYMDVNNYATDGDFPEDQAAAIVLYGTAGGLDICWRGR